LGVERQDQATRGKISDLRLLTSQKEVVMRIGERVQKLCLHSGLSLHDLENAAGLEAGYLMRILEGKDVPSCEILGRLAAALEVPPVRLFYEEGEDILTSKLTPRPTLEQLARDCAPTPLVIVAISKVRRLLDLC
jgi:transcriptional regulator with XRE-family HTH domain